MSIFSEKTVTLGGLSFDPEKITDYVFTIKKSNNSVGSLTIELGHSDRISVRAVKQEFDELYEFLEEKKQRK